MTAESGEVQAAARSYARSQDLVDREAAAVGNVMKIRFYPFMPVSAQRHAHHGRRRQRVPRPDRAPAGVAAGRLRPPAHPPGDRRPARRAADGDALLPPDDARRRAGRAAVRAGARRLREEGVVRHDGLGRERLRLPAAADGHRAAAPDLVRRLLPRPDDAARPLLSGHQTQATVIGLGNVTKVPYPDPYRCMLGPCSRDGCSLKCLEHVERYALGARSRRRRTPRRS